MITTKTAMTILKMFLGTPNSPLVLLKALT
jgi:hypothetical protein